MAAKKKATKKKVASKAKPAKKKARATTAPAREAKLEKTKTAAPELEEKRGTKTHVEKMEAVDDKTHKTASNAGKKNVEGPESENDLQMDRLSLIRLRHESMKKAIEQIREDLEVEADDLGLIVD